jgi:hypothetical protein
MTVRHTQTVTESEMAGNEATTNVDDIQSTAVKLDADYFMEHPEQYDLLSEERRLELLNNGFVSAGDTGTAAAATEVIDTPVDDPGKAAQTEKDAAAAEEAAKAASESAANTQEIDGVLTKDGKHVLPYSALQDARSEAQHWKEEAEKAQRTAAEREKVLQGLEAAKAADEETGGTQAQEDFLAGLNEEFPELAARLAPAISGMIKQGVAAAVAEIQGQLKPLQDAVVETEQDRHFNAIRGAHQDYDALMATTKVDDWIKTQPAILQPTYEAILAKGTATQVIELVDLYKKDNPTETAVVDDTAKANAAEIAAKAKLVTDKAAAEKKAPSSMSEIPASTVEKTSEAEALLQKDGKQLVDAFAGKTPAQIEALVARMI